MMDEPLFLDKVLRMTEEEHDLLERCFTVLDEHEIAACQNEAREIAAAEIRADDAATLLTETLVTVVLRGVRSTRLEVVRRRAGSKRKRRAQ